MYKIYNFLRERTKLYILQFYIYIKFEYNLRQTYLQIEANNAFHHINILNKIAILITG